MRTLCQGTDRLYRTTDRVFRIVECASCRLVRLYPRPKPAELRTYYPESYWFDPSASTADRLAETWRQIVLRDHIRFVRRALDASAAKGLVLDVGCGGGLFLRQLELPRGQAVGLDFSLGAASVAWGTNGVPAVCASLTRAPFPKGICRAVTMFHVLEHLYDPASHLDAARDLLAADGRLIIQVPNLGCWQFLMLGEHWNGLDIPRHLINFRERDIRVLLEETGFELLRVKHFSLRDNPAGLASSLAPALDPMSRRVRQIQESPGVKMLKDFTYLALVLLAMPLAVLEAACRAGSTLMVEARPKP